MSEMRTLPKGNVQAHSLRPLSVACEKRKAFITHATDLNLFRRAEGIF